MANKIRSNTIVPLIQHIEDVIHLDGNSELFKQAALIRTKNFLQDMDNQFQAQENRIPDTVKERLQSIQRAVQEARQLFDRWQRQQPCLDCLLCRPKLSQQIKKWETSFDELFHQLQRDFSTFCNSEQIVASPRHMNSHTCYEPDFGFIGSGITSAQMELEIWLTETPHVNVIGVYGMCGVGKTTLLQKIYNVFKIPTFDFNFSTAHPRLDRDMYDRLKWSYNSLPTKLKNCFLYCAMFPEDLNIDGKMLQNMWVAEGFLKSREAAYLTDRENSCIKLLEDRCLFKVDLCTRCNIFNLRSHDVVRDMVIYIGERYENCLLRAGRMLQQFPDTEIKKDCKRISVYENDIRSLPSREVICPELVSLIFTRNLGLTEMPEAFLRNLTSLRVLDLSFTQIESLPATLWELTQLAFLNLSSTEIEEVSEGIGNLCSLRFLYLNKCTKLKSLSSKIGELRNLKYLDIKFCDSLKVNPHEMMKMLSKCEIAHEY